MGLVHAQGPEELRLRIVAQGLSRDALDCERQQRVARVAVEAFLTRGEVQLLLPSYQGENVALGDHIIHPPAGQSQQVPLVPQPAGVMDQVAQRDRLPEVRHFGHMPPNVIVERELALLGQQEDRHRSELLGDGSDVEDRGWADRDLVLEIGQAIAATIDHLTVPYHRQRAAGRVRLIPGCKQCIHLLSHGPLVAEESGSSPGLFRRSRLRSFCG